MQNINSMKICTWNLWFSQFMQKKRIEMAMLELQSQNFDIICLQEVNQLMIDEIKKCPIFNAYLIIYNIQCITPYVQIFLVKNDLSHKIVNFELIYFPQSNMSRKISHLSLNNGINILNIHLESQFEKNPSKSDIKFLQLDYLLNYAQKLPKVIICGDFNVNNTDEILFTTIINKHKFYDIGLKINTYDYKQNNNIQDHFQSGLDRILCNFNCSYLNSGLIGLKPFLVKSKNNSFECYSSDHFGLNINIKI